MRAFILLSVAWGISSFGFDIPFDKRPLQSLDVYSTFKLPKDLGSLKYASGVYDQKGLVQGDLKESDAYCLVDAVKCNEVPEGEALKKWEFCELQMINGVTSYAGEEKRDYQTDLELDCRGGQKVTVSCHRISKGEAKEMELGELQAIIGKTFQFADLKLEANLVEKPITPEQIISGRLRFSFSEQSPMRFRFDGKGNQRRYEHFLQDGNSIRQLTDIKKGYLTLYLFTPDKTPFPAPMTSEDFNGMKITSADTSYRKIATANGNQFRNSLLIVRGKKTVFDAEVDLAISWIDFANNHITFDGMRKIPGPDFIKNWYEQK